MICIKKITDEDFKMNCIPFVNPRVRLGAIVIAFDNDNKGEIGSRQLKKKLTEIGVSSFSVTLTGHECKDINELLQTDRGKLEEIYNYVNENVTRAYDAIKQEEEGELVLG